MASRQQGNRGSGARPTKAERKDQARREREEIQARMARAKRNRWIAIGVVVVVVAAVGVFVVTRPKSSSTASATDAANLLSTADAEAQAAGCTEARNVGEYQPSDLDGAHVGTEDGPAEMPALSTYPSSPPASGPHSGSTLAAGVYTSAPAIDLLIHSLEHGAAIVWYAPGASGPELERIKDFYRSAEVGSRVIVAPYDYPDEGAAGALPAGSEMALVSWHHVETCAQANLAAAFGFTARYAAPPFGEEAYLGDAPEPGAPL
jgi:hypothetical protein